MSNKTQNSNYVSLLRKSGSYKNMLNFMAIVYLFETAQRLMRDLPFPYIHKFVCKGRLPPKVRGLAALETSV